MGAGGGVGAVGAGAVGAGAKSGGGVCPAAPASAETRRQMVASRAARERCKNLPPGTAGPWGLADVRATRVCEPCP